MSLDPATVNALFDRHYLLMAFLASLGTLQVAVSISGARGLWLAPNALATRWIGIALIIGAMAIFVLQPLWVEGPWAVGTVEADSSKREWGVTSWGEVAAARNVNDIFGGLSGTGQATWFPVATALAFIVSAAVGAVNMRLFPPAEAEKDAGDVDGLGGLAEAAYPMAARRSWRRFGSEVTQFARSAFDRADPWSLAKIWQRTARR